MSKFQMFLLLLAVLLGLFNLFRGHEKLPVSNSPADLVSVTNYVFCVTSNNVCLSTNLSVSSSDVLVKRGPFKFFPCSSHMSDYVLFGNARLIAGMLCEYGYVKSISSQMVSGETFEGGVFYLLPEFPPPPIEGGSVVIQRSDKPQPSRRGPF